jgi:hypothetical protein
LQEGTLKNSTVGLFGIPGTVNSLFPLPRDTKSFLNLVLPSSTDQTFLTLDAAADPDGGSYNLYVCR